MFHIVRAFDNDEVLHVDDSIDPVRDLDTIQSELCKKDLDILQRTIVAEEQIVRKAGGKYKMLPLFTETTTKIKALLEKDQPVRDGSWTPAEITLINEKIQLITTKPVIYLVNLTMKDYLRQKSKYLPQIAKWVTEHGGTPRDIIPFSIEFEEKLDKLSEDPAKKAEFLEECKVKSKLDKIVTEGFDKLGLQYYFTGMHTLLIDHTGSWLTTWQLARRRSGAGPSNEAVLHLKPLVPSMAISKKGSSKPRWSRTRTSTTFVEAPNQWLLSRPLESIDRKERHM